MTALVVAAVVAASPSFVFGRTGGNVVRACALLPAVTGNLGRQGAGFLYLNGTESRAIDEIYLTAPKLRSAAKRVASILSVEVGAHGEAVGVGRGHVLGGMDGDVDPPGEQRLLDLLDEHAARADLAERLRPVFVARGRDRDERDLDTVAPQPIGRELGLRQREPATAAADPDQAQG